jgi:hypothetical protein
VVPGSVGRITDAILLLRGHKVLLDAELAVLYGVETKRLNEQVKRNLARFPADFMFRLTGEEVTSLNRSQIATGSQRHRDPRFPPYAFTEHGAIMAATILNSERAVEMSIHVVRAFVYLRELIASNAELARQLRMLETKVKRKFATHDAVLTGILKTIRELMSPPLTPKRSIGFVELQERKK